MFLGYSNLHKEFKCLDLAEGCIYISRDVVFDERVFPFTSLRPNAGAWLRAEMHLLPDVLLNPTSSLGNVNLSDHNTSSPMPANPPSSSGGDLIHAEKNLEQGAADSGENGGCYRMCYLPGDSTQAETDLPRTAGRSAGGSESGSAPSFHLMTTGGHLVRARPWLRDRLRQLRQLLPL